jgi:glycosyltransferase involved in cell wall biosynthesis
MVEARPGQEARPGDGDRLRLGILHVGRQESGVRRYGRILTDELANRPDIRLTQADAGLLEDRRGGLGARGAVFARADVQAVLMQWNRRGWGRGPRSAYRLVDFRRAWRGPLVVTLHDVFDRDGLRERWLQPEMWGLRLVARTADRVVVHSDVEIGRLRGIVPQDKLRVIPHFVEQRSLPLTPAEARARLGVEGRRVVTLLGFIYGRKGHVAAAEAIAALPPDVLVVFAGGNVAGRDKVLRTVEQLSREQGLADRLRITGYLSEEEMETWMAASHLAILPFRDLSASGSLSTWIAAGKPMLTTDLDGFREVDARAPGALRFFPSLDPAAIARAITAALDDDLTDPDPRVVALREQLTVPRTVDRYLDVVREVAVRPAR